MRAAIDVTRLRDSIGVPPAVAELLDLVNLASSLIGTAEVPPAPDLPASPVHEMSTAEAARLLGTSTRNVRGLASREAIAARRVGRAWVLDRDDVLAHALRQRERRAAA